MGMKEDINCSHINNGDTIKFPFNQPSLSQTISERDHPKTSLVEQTFKLISKLINNSITGGWR